MLEKLKELRIFKEAEELADEIWKEVCSWSYFERRTIGTQLVDAVDSVGANIAEGYGRYYYKQILTFLYISRGSLFETATWLGKANRRKIISDEKFKRWESKIEHLSPQLNAYIAERRRKSTKGKSNG